MITMKLALESLSKSEERAGSSKPIKRLYPNLSKAITCEKCSIIGYHPDWYGFPSKSVHPFVSLPPYSVVELPI